MRSSPEVVFYSVVISLGFTHSFTFAWEVHLNFYSIIIIGPQFLKFNITLYHDDIKTLSVVMMQNIITVKWLICFCYWKTSLVICSLLKIYNYQCKWCQRSSQFIHCFYKLLKFLILSSRTTRGFGKVEFPLHLKKIRLKGSFLPLCVFNHDCTVFNYVLANQSFQKIFGRGM